MEGGNPSVTNNGWRSQATNYNAGPAPVNNGPQPVAPVKPAVPVKPKKSSGSGGTVLGVCALMLALLGTSLAGYACYKIFMDSTPSATANGTSYYSGNTATFENSTVGDVVSKVTPAVVSIVCEMRVNSYSYWSGGQTVTSAGTGMIVTKDGYIITNKHVIDGATHVEVVTDDGTTYDDVKIVGKDPLNDVAYLKISGVSDLPTIPLGDSKSVIVGQPVIAVGNALGAFQNSVTSGIISGTGRSIQAQDSDGNVESLSDMIQTDAAINPGNSGGPLVNAAGEVIAINSATATDADGLGFAIPISATKGMLNNIIENDQAKRAYLGLAYITITPEVAKTFNLSVTSGAYIYSESGHAVVSGGPADTAGIMDGDIITHIGGVALGSAGSISSLVGEYKVGDSVEFQIIRNGETKKIIVTLGAYNE